MDRTKIVTGLVILSLAASLGCKAKFTSKNKPASPSAGATGGFGTAAPTGPVKDPNAPLGPQVPPPSGQPPVVTRPPVGQPPVILPPPDTHPRRPHPNTCPTDADGSVGKNRVVQQKTIVFKRGRQMIWRKNCEGQVISKRFENLGANTMKTVVIKPVGGQGPMSIYNRTTCHATTRQNALACGPSGEYSFTVSTQKTNHAMHVKPGPNYIDYTIGGEQGTLILNVRIDETVDDCIVINAKGCAPKREAHWSDNAFGSN